MDYFQECKLLFVYNIVCWFLTTTYIEVLACFYSWYLCPNSTVYFWQGSRRQFETPTKEKYWLWNGPWKNCFCYPEENVQLWYWSVCAYFHQNTTGDTFQHSVNRSCSTYLPPNLLQEQTDDLLQTYIIHNKIWN